MGRAVHDASVFHLVKVETERSVVPATLTGKPTTTRPSALRFPSFLWQMRSLELYQLLTCCILYLFVKEIYCARFPLSGAL